jgi:hypothetical protein
VVVTPDIFSDPMKKETKAITNQDQEKSLLPELRKLGFVGL